MKKFEYPWPKMDETIIPDKDFVWQDFIKIREYFHEIIPEIEKMQQTIEKQDIEIDKLKRHVSSRVQKIEIVKFLGEDNIPKKDFLTIPKPKWEHCKKSKACNYHNGHNGDCENY